MVVPGSFGDRRGSKRLASLPLEVYRGSPVRSLWLDTFDRLSAPIDFQAVDRLPVDLVFLLLSPPDAGADHLKALAAISRVIRHSTTLEKMRGARSRDALAAVLIAADERDAA